MDNVRSEESFSFVELSIAEIMTRYSVRVRPVFIAANANADKAEGTRRGWARQE